MPARKPLQEPPQDDPEQSKRFIDMAREVEADESPDAFERAFTKVVRPPAGELDQTTRKRDA